MSPFPDFLSRRALLVLGLLFALFVLSLAILPSLLVREGPVAPAARLALESQIRLSLAAFWGVLALFAGALGVAMFARNLGQVAQEATRTLAAAQQTAHFAAQSGETERYARAMGLLGAPQIEVRLGGIFALERLARESRAEHGPIMEVLAAYAREHAAWREGEAVAARPPADLQAILTVIGRRHAAFDPSEGHIDLHATGLARAYLPSANLAGAWLYEANLAGAILQNADLRGAWLWKSDLSGATLDGALLQGADLTATIGLSAEQLKSAHFDEATRLPQHLRGEVESPLAAPKKAASKAVSSAKAASSAPAEHPEPVSEDDLKLPSLRSGDA